MSFKKIIILLLLLNSFQMTAQYEDIHFRRIPPSIGFSFEAIRFIEQDKFGYIWMASYDGVMRYDSKDVITFRHIKDDVTGLPSNRVSGIAIDNENNIWVSTDKGLAKFNPVIQQFEKINYLVEGKSYSNENINSIALDGHGNLWIAHDSYFGFLNSHNDKFERITEGVENHPYLVYYDESNRLWLATEDGAIYSVLANEKRVEKKITSPGSRVRTIFAANNDIWVGYDAHGAKLYDLEGNFKIHYTYDTEPGIDLKTTSVRKIWRDTKGRIWIGSYLGLFLDYGSDLRRFDINNYSGLTHNSVHAIFEDRQGLLWIGAWSGSVSFIHHSDNKFKNYRYSKVPGSISNNMISSFAQSPSGELFVGTEGAGLNKFDVKTAKLNHIKVLNSDKFLNIKAMCFDNKGGHWVGSLFEGLFYKPEGASKFIQFTKGENDGNHVSSRSIYSILPTDEGVWIGTADNGLNFYDFKTKKIIFFDQVPFFNEIKGLNIRALFLDSNKNLWIGTLNGLIRIDLVSEQISYFNSKSLSNHKTLSSTFYFITELSDKKIWIGTKTGGINIYDPKTDKLSNFDANGLLQNKDVYGIIEDSQNNIWITSNSGLILFNKHDNTYRRFINSDGIQGNNFNPQAIFKDYDQQLYFGGTNGFTRLTPEKIKINKRPPNIFINSVEINNAKSIPVQSGINQFSKIKLEPGPTTLKFDFSADSYLLPRKNKFKYRLINYLDKWMDAETGGSATFVNIPAGKYVFEVRASNNDGIWNRTSAKLPIIVEQHWYKTKLAISFYILLVIGVYVLYLKFGYDQAVLKEAFLVEKLERESEDQIHEMKLKFFTNISHEFRTPLTLIKWPIKALLEAKNLSTDQISKLEAVNRNTNRLLYLINQLMDLRKVEKGHAKLNITKVELIDFVNERILSFAEEAKSRHIDFVFTKNIPELYVELDEEKLDKVIYNLLSNAFKHVPVKGKIEVRIQDKFEKTSEIFSNQLSFGKLEIEDFVEILVMDNGQGIDSEDLHKIFNRFEQGSSKKKKENSTGIGLTLCKEYTLLHNGTIIVQSTPSKGSRFAVRIPKKQDAQKIFYESTQKIKNFSTETQINKLNKVPKVKKDQTILIVEDNIDLKKLLVGYLEKHYTIESRINGKQGLDVLAVQNIDLIISDVMMPVMDGFEFTIKVKSQIETSHIPVILLTALSSSENRASGIEKGADAYISKPFDENILLLQIENLLTQRKRLQENYIQKYIAKQPMEIGNLDNYFLNKINAIVEENMENEDFSTEMLSKELAMSRSHLHRKLKQISNYSTSEYINLVKIKKATSLISSKQFTIDEVSYKTGFNSPSYFTKCFKKVHGKSPREYLKGID